MSAVPGFQLYNTKREQAGSVKEELTKVVRIATVTSMNLEKMKTAIGTRFLHNQPAGQH